MKNLLLIISIVFSVKSYSLEGRYIGLNGEKTKYIYDLSGLDYNDRAYLNHEYSREFFFDAIDFEKDKYVITTFYCLDQKCSKLFKRKRGRIKLKKRRVTTAVGNFTLHNQDYIQFIFDGKYGRKLEEYRIKMVNENCFDFGFPKDVDSAIFRASKNDIELFQEDGWNYNKRYCKDTESKLMEKVIKHLKK